MQHAAVPRLHLVMQTCVHSIAVDRAPLVVWHRPQMTATSEGPRALLLLALAAWPGVVVRGDALQEHLEDAGALPALRLRPVWPSHPVPIRTAIRSDANETRTEWNKTADIVDLGMTLGLSLWF